MQHHDFTLVWLMLFAIAIPFLFLGRWQLCEYDARCQQKRQIEQKRRHEAELQNAELRARQLTADRLEHWATALQREWYMHAKLH